MRVLVVEDEADMRKLVTRYVEMLGYQHVTAENGVKALDLARKFPIDVVLSDVEMPEMDGITFVTRFKQIAPFVPVVMLSGQREIAVVLTCIRAGALDFVEKERVVEDLEITLRKAIAVRQRELALRTVRENAGAVRNLVDELKTTLGAPTAQQAELLTRLDRLFELMKS
ncbi:MAG: response regulator [Myxococcales bacterium]|nr:response regulator [Myxococcales bacterium]